jgi:hypothetical protein
MKTCTQCKQEFPKTLEYFYKKKNGLHFYCKECAKANAKSWQKTNPEKVNASHKTYYKANPEKEKTRKKIYYLANPKKINAKSSAWRKANPEKANALARKYRAKKLGNGFEPYTLEEIFETYGTNCYLCDLPINFNVSGRPGSNPQWRSGLHIEHFIDIALGGSDTIENVRPSHAWCNLTKGSK